MFLNDDQPCVEPVVEARTHQGGRVIEEPVGDRRADGKRDQRMRKRKIDAGQKQRGRACREARGDQCEADVERGAQRRVFAPDALE